MRTLPFDRDMTWRPHLTSERANITDRERIGSATVGAALLTYGLKRRDWMGALSAVTGAALLYRGATGYCQVSEAAGRNTRRDSEYRSEDTKDALAGPRGVNVCEAVTIQRSAPDLYQEWRNLEELPLKMRHLESVSELSDGTSHWEARGPGGKVFEWDAEILQDIPGKLLSWRSLPGADVVSAGSVNFDEVPGHGTRVTVRLQYDPPGGKLGAYVAWLMRQEPSQQIREDLREWKRRLETGEGPTTEGQPSARSTSRATS
ncbi:MAG: SRPBCC family protein [Vicinamibacterales bacterium]